MTRKYLSQQPISFVTKCNLNIFTGYLPDPVRPGLLYKQMCDAKYVKPFNWAVQNGNSLFLSYDDLLKLGMN